MLDVYIRWIISIVHLNNDDVYVGKNLSCCFCVSFTLLIQKLYRRTKLIKCGNDCVKSFAFFSKLVFDPWRDFGVGTASDNTGGGIVFEFIVEGLGANAGDLF